MRGGEVRNLHLLAFDGGFFHLLRHPSLGSDTGLIIPVSHQAGARGNQLTDQHVLLQANQVVNLALDGGIGQDLGCLLYTSDAADE